MGQMILVRHGQANFAAQDEEGYDRLSELGQRQAAWLGDWLRSHEAPFDRVLSGSLRRHVATAEAMGFAPEIDPRFNEMDYFNLGQALRDTHGVPLPGPGDFDDHMPRVMEAWHAAEIRGNEDFDEFEARVTAALADAAREGERVLCVTSGGVIGMVMRHLLLLDPRRMAHVLLPIWNTSIHRVEVRPRGTVIAAFNAIPHLDAPERAEARTHF